MNSTERNHVLGECFDPWLIPKGFERVRPRQWVRSSLPQVREMIKLVSYSVEVAPIWGWSIDFVPHVKDAKLARHATAKGCQFDLRFDPVDYDQNWRTHYAIELDPWRGRTFDLDPNGKPKRICTAALSMFDRVRSLADLPAEFEAKRHRTSHRFGWTNYVQEPLAYAFVLAALGEKERAEVQFAEAVSIFDDLYLPVARQLRSRMHALFPPLSV